MFFHERTMKVRDGLKERQSLCLVVDLLVTHLLGSTGALDVRECILLRWTQPCQGLQEAQTEDKAFHWSPSVSKLSMYLKHWTCSFLSLGVYGLRLPPTETYSD